MYTITDKEFTSISEYMRTNYGILLKPEKKTLVMGRMQNVLIEGKFNNFTSYFDYLISNKTGEAVTTLINKLTTNHTFFLREVEHFNFFRNSVLPYLISGQAVKKDLRIWSAGCSRGDEPYTLAMILLDYFGVSKSMWDSKILATDISTDALEKAIKGIFHRDEMTKIPKIWKMNYFHQLNAQDFQIKSIVKDEVLFRKLNLNNSSFPFQKKFHVIFCRNVMIYFDKQAKKELVNRFYELLEPGGYLFIGHSESISREEANFKYIIPAVYRKE
ncbi:MAG: chemotaxis protein CheR [Firmicutes bacterium HGW-Firmicutes-1]|nr:MAG: chemotaxis protein CheR [Firmicutes bacterium HGW-Firmicutes-1]